MIEVEIEDERWSRALPDAAAVVERTAGAVLEAPFLPEGGRVGDGGDPTGLDTNTEEGAGAQLRVPGASGASTPIPALPPLRGKGENVTVLLTDDATIRDLNARFRGKDAATNVLSFPAPQSARPHIGDVALAYGVCASEAQAQGKTLRRHLMHLTAHGVLHLLGYDHQTDAEAEAMEALERRILHDLGAPDPYGAEGHTDPDAR